MFSTCLSSLPENPGGVSAALSPDALERLPQPVRTLYLERARHAADAPLTQLLASQWLAFARTGNRAVYETPYFERRRRLNDLVCGLLLRDDPRWMDEALNTIWAICEESAWQVPAHNVYIRDAVQNTWPDLSRPVVDLFAAETGALLACADNVLGDRLPGEVRARIGSEIGQRVLTPYLKEQFWWMGDSGTHLNNWTPWCTQNVLLCAFTQPAEAAVRRAIIAKAAHSLDCFLDEYGEDGCCAEGAQYYGHAGLCLFGCLELLCRAVPGVFDALWKEPKLRNMAAYIRNMHVGGRYYFNFADCSPCAGRRSARDYLFALRLGDKALASFAAQDWMESLGEPQKADSAARINLWHQLIELACAADMAALAEHPRGDGTCSPDAVYESCGVYIARRGTWSLAVKGGSNDDSHNHNDVGSVILYRNEKPLLIDLGVETYSRKTFSAQRYEIWTMQSSWHNLPSFDGVMQHEGAQYGARDVHVTRSGESFRVDMELAGAWPEQARISSFRRTVTLTEQGLNLSDCCSGAYTQAELHLMTCEKPELRQDGSVTVGTLGKLRIAGAAGPVCVEEVPVTDERLRAAWSEKVYRIIIPFAQNVSVDVT